MRSSELGERMSAELAGSGELKVQSLELGERIWAELAGTLLRSEAMEGKVGRTGWLMRFLSLGTGY